MSDLFIPKKIKVGFQDRKGTYTGRLAYVIYYDNKGVLRKEKSWEGWRDSKIDPQEFENAPQDGFCLNKNVKRFNWGHFGSSNNSYIRMYDPRGIEFEITPENLIGILTETDCLKRGLEGKFVYAWKGTELVLLPCCSEEYKQAVVHTERQDQDVSAKNLQPGFSYTTKKGEEVVYLGRFPWYEWSPYWKDVPRTPKKKHVFVHVEKQTYGGQFFNKGDVKFLAAPSSTEAVPNYAELIDEWNKDVRSASFDKWEFSPANISALEVFGTDEEQLKYPHIKNGEFIEVSGNTISFCRVQAQASYGKPPTYYIQTTGRLDIANLKYDSHGSNYGYSYNGMCLPKEKIMERVANAVKVKVTLSNGKKIKVDSIYSIARS